MQQYTTLAGPAQSATDSEPRSQRYYYLDAMRSVLMCLVVLFHAGKIYTVNSHWVINDPARSAAFNILDIILPSFRMPAFFIISGFFCHLSLTKYDLPRFLRIRLVRIIVPLLCTAGLLNTVQFWFKFSIIDGNGTSLLSFASTRLLGIWMSNGGLSHLWFLVNLIFYFSLSALGYAFLSGRANPFRKHPRLLSLMRSQTLLIFGFPTMSVVILGIGTAIPPVVYGKYMGFIDMYSLVQFVPFYLFGIWIFRDEKMRRSFQKFRIWSVPLFVLCLLVSEKTSLTGHLSEKIIHVHFGVMASWISSSWCFSMFSRFLNHRSVVFQYLSDASYSIYLFHHLTVIALGYFLLGVHAHPILKWLIIVIMTGCITGAIHHFLILRINVLRFMFNGKLNKAARC